MTGAELRARYVGIVLEGDVESLDDMVREAAYSLERAIELRDQAEASASRAISLAFRVWTKKEEFKKMNEQKVETVGSGHSVVNALSALSQDIHANAKEKGWYDLAPGEDTPHFRDFVNSKLMLIVSEISEACEELRSATTTEHLRRVYFGDSPKPEGFGVELADAIIRAMDLAEFLGIPLGSMLMQKHEFNRTRPYRHGKKV